MSGVRWAACRGPTQPLSQIPGRHGDGMFIARSSTVCHWGGLWDCRLGVGVCQPTGITTLTLFSAVPLPGCPSSTPAE